MSVSLLRVVKLILFIMVVQLLLCIAIFSQIILDDSTVSATLMAHFKNTKKDVTLNNAKSHSNLHVRQPPHSRNVRAIPREKAGMHARYFDDEAGHKNKVPVIIGGSDGSGTRSFVDLLARLGVPMLLDDPITLDIAGSMLCDRQGWPPLAKMALVNRKHPIDQWPVRDQNQSRFEMEKLRHLLDMRFSRKMRRLATVEHIDTSKLATKVLYGFKAPITMVLLPMIQAYLYPTGFKYIHVVRDGRDVALSSNQSPVKKFYTSTYPNNDDARLRMQKYRNTTHVLAMQLWNDWNVDLYEWAMKEKQRNAAAASSMHKTKKKKKNDDDDDDDDFPSFDYLVVRSEDFLNPDTKFQSLQVLANFIGSTLTEQEICCLSQRQSRDMGQSHVFNYNHTNQTSGVTRWNHGHSSLSNAAVPKRLRDRDTSSAALSNTLLLEKESPRRRLFELELLERQLVQHKGQWTPEMAAQHGGLRHMDHSHNKTKIDRLAGLRHHDRQRDELRLRGVGHGRGPPLDYGDEALGKLMMDQLEDLYARKTLSKNRSVTERYGKWSYLLELNSSLFLLFHSEGARGLQLFGYEPRKDTLYDAASFNNSYTCNSTSSADMSVQCGQKK